MNTTFKITAETRVSVTGETLFRIQALVDIPARGVKKGDLGGFISTEKTKYGNARVSGNAWVYGDAQVYGNARVYGNAQVYGNAWVYGDAQVYGNARVSGNAHIDCAAAILWITIGAYYTITVTRQWVFIGCKSWNRKAALKGVTKKQAKDLGCPSDLHPIITSLIKTAYKRIKAKPEKTK